MRSITEHDLRKVLRTMVNRGVKRMSVRVHQGEGELPDDVAAAIDTTVDHYVVISAQWSAANMGNVASLDILSVEILG